MKTFIFSDIHSNLEALLVAADYYDKYSRPKRVICLGDIVGYGPDPGECLDKILALTDKICMGNHDLAIIRPEEEAHMNSYAQEGVRYSRKMLSEKQKSIITGFPFSISEENILYCHSTPVKPEEWDYIVTEYDARRYLGIMECNLCFVGHSHIPGVYSTGTVEKKESIFEIPADAKTIINVGSIGQPRDNDPRLSFFILDDENLSVEQVSLEYDLETTIAKIKKAGLPPFLGQRLREGY